MQQFDAEVKVRKGSMVEELELAMDRWCSVPSVPPTWLTIG